MPGQRNHSWLELPVDFCRLGPGWPRRADIKLAMQAQAVVTYKVRIRFFPGITHQHRLLWRDKTMEIASVVERDVRTMHEILAREVE